MWYSCAFLANEAMWKKTGVQTPQSPPSVVGRGNFLAAGVAWAKHFVDKLLPGYQDTEDKGTEQLIDSEFACPLSKPDCQQTHLYEYGCLNPFLNSFPEHLILTLKC